MGIIVDDLLRIGTPSSGGQPTKNDISNACAVINSIDDLRTWDYFIWDYQYSYDFSEVLTLLDYFYIEKYGSSIKDNPEYHIIFSTYFGSCKTGGYFADSQSNLQNFLEDDYFQKYGSYSKPGIFLVEPCFGYYSSANILAYTKETVPIDDTLIYKFEIYMTETKMNSSGKSH